MKGGGIGYGLIRYKRGDKEVEARMKRGAEAEISFNYAGQYDGVMTKGKVVRIVEGRGREGRGGQEERKYKIDVMAYIGGGKLRVVWYYCENLHNPQTIERVAKDFTFALKELIQKCREPEPISLIPSDFPLANLDEEKMDKLSRLINDLETSNT